MEPVFLALGAASAEAAALAIGRGTALQDVGYGELRAKLLETGQALGQGQEKKSRCKE